MNITEIIEARWTTSSLKEKDGSSTFGDENTIHVQMKNLEKTYYMSIPKDSENTDYLDLMRWVDDGNTIKAADE